MKDKRIVWFSAFRHLVPADYETWLETMADEGWHINHFRQWSSIFMILKRGEPKHYRYVYDPQASPRKDYIATYEQFGWHYLGRMASAHFWRMEYTGKRPEAFSDSDSVVARNRRTMMAVSVSFFIFIFLDLFFAGMQLFFSKSFSDADRTQIIAAEVFFFILMVALGIVMLIIRKNEKC
jgi:hypothetical protein